MSVHESRPPAIDPYDQRCWRPSPKLLPRCGLALSSPSCRTAHEARCTSPQPPLITAAVGASGIHRGDAKPSAAPLGRVCSRLNGQKMAMPAGKARRAWCRSGPPTARPASAKCPEVVQTYQPGLLMPAAPRPRRPLTSPAAALPVPRTTTRRQLGDGPTPRHRRSPPHASRLPDEPHAPSLGPAPTARPPRPALRPRLTAACVICRGTPGRRTRPPSPGTHMPCPESARHDVRDPSASPAAGDGGVPGHGGGGADGRLRPGGSVVAACAGAPFAGRDRAGCRAWLPAEVDPGWRHASRCLLSAAGLSTRPGQPVARREIAGAPWSGAGAATRSIRPGLRLNDARRPEDTGPEAQVAAERLGASSMLGRPGCREQDLT